MMCCAHQVFERVFEVTCKVAPVACVDLQTLQYCGDLCRDCACLVFTQNTAAPVDQVEVIGETKGQATTQGMLLRASGPPPFGAAVGSTKALPAI